jgi:2'-hydroxyisoflavone reductase
MRLLVLGGTVFLSWQVAAEAVRRGHEVTCAARGASGSVPEGAELVRVDRDDPSGLDPLRNRDFDAVVDVATMSYPWAERAVRQLGERAAHWTFVSTVSVYADGRTLGQGTDGPLLPARREQGSKATAADPSLYGSIKVASENVVRETLGERAFIVRAGLITGPGDQSDRFGYWPGRMTRPEINNGRMVVPDTPDQPMQYIDVRDLAAWIVHAGEHGTAGTYDGTGLTQPLSEVLAGIAEAVTAEVELVPLAAEDLAADGVRPWAGPKSLPLWLPEEMHGMLARDVRPAFQAGLRTRPLAETVTAALAYERSLGLDRDRKAGLTPVEEAKVLAKFAPET